MNNYSQFNYDPYGRNSKIVETSSGSITSTKQFVWCAKDRCEQRDQNSNILAQYFTCGTMMAGSNYYWTKDHSPSVREMTNSSGVVEAQYSYDPFGRVLKLRGSLTSDFQFANYYFHLTSGLGLPVARCYSSILGRWIQRDPMQEAGGKNLFTFNNNSPLNYTDPTGNYPIRNVNWPSGSEIKTNAPPEVIAIGGHGEPGSFSTTADWLGNLGPHASPSDIAKALKDSGLISGNGTSNRSHGVPGNSCVIHLCACHGADVGDSISYARALARATGCWVVACTGLVDPNSGQSFNPLTVGIPGTSITITVKNLNSPSQASLFNPSGFQSEGSFSTPLSDSSWGTITGRGSLYGPGY